MTRLLMYARHALNAPWAMENFWSYDMSYQPKNHAIKTFSGWLMHSYPDKIPHVSAFVWDRAVEIFSGAHRRTASKFVFDFLAAHPPGLGGSFFPFPPHTTPCDRHRSTMKMDEDGLAYSLCSRRFSVICEKGRRVDSCKSPPWVVNPNNPPNEIVIFEDSNHDSSTLDLSVDFAYGECDTDKVGTRIAEMMLTSVFDHLTASWSRVLEIATSHIRHLVRGKRSLYAVASEY